MQFHKLNLHLTYTHLSAFGFILVILLGATLLSLPISSKSGEFTPFLNALFTATSATCITGLVIYDTYSHFSIFGQTILLILIQIGGLGFMMIATLFALALNKRIGIRTRGLIRESINSSQIGGIVRLAKNILLGTLFFESIGALILAIHFRKEMGSLESIYNGIFHAVSAFCNAGFDLMGRHEAFSSLMTYRGDIIVNVVIMGLIIVGGIGFVVWEDLRLCKFRIKEYQLHTKIVLITTFLLILFSSFIFYFIEKEHLLADASLKESILSPLFLSITSRTAGVHYKLLCLLVANKGKVLTHNYIQKNVWGYEESGDSKSIRVFMTNLRRKIEKDKTSPRFILTEIGVGYRFSDE